MNDLSETEITEDLVHDIVSEIQEEIETVSEIPIISGRHVFVIHGGV